MVHPYREAIEAEIVLGSVVQMNSGGPEMTVIGFNDPEYNRNKNQVLCRWFDRNGKLDSAWFYVKTIRVKRHGVE